MKQFNNFLRGALFTAVFSVCSLAFAGTGDFNAWVFKTGHDGAAGGKLTFPEHDLTVEMWLNLDANPGNLSGIIGTVNGSTGFLVEVRTGTTSTNGEDNLRFFAKPLTGTNNVDLRIPLSKVIGQWTHVAYVISSKDNKAYLYVNGEPFNTGYNIANFDVAQGGWMGNASGTTTSSSMSFVKWYTNPKPLGKIADFRVWNVARSAADIKANFDKNLESSTNPGLIVNYIFSPFERGMSNNANSADATNKLWLNPATDYQNYHSAEVLSYKPDAPTFNNTDISWTTPGDLTSNTWVAEITNKATGTVVRMDTVSTGSVTLKDLPSGDYSARVRTKNASFYSGWSLSTDFTLISAGVLNPKVNDSFILQSGLNSIVIVSEKSQPLNIYGIDGRLVRSVNVIAGKNTIGDIAKGVYLVYGRKVIVR